MSTEATEINLVVAAAEIKNTIPAQLYFEAENKSSVLPGIKSLILDQSDSYFGGKGSDGTYQKIINQIPKHEIFIETHAGHAKITEKMNCFNGITILNDIDPEVCEFLKKKFESRLGGPIWKHRLLSKSGVNEFFDASHGKVIVENLDAIDLVVKYRVAIEHYKTVIFSDPPYPMKSRKSQEARYNFEMTDDEHEDLIMYLRLYDSPVMICTYPNEIYNKFLSDWRAIDYMSNTRHGMAQERIYLNYDVVLDLQTVKYFGNDYREREKYKKIIANLKRKLKSLPIPLMNSILEDLIKQEL